MLSKIIKSYKNINHKLFFSLLIMGLVPTIYTTLRVFWLGNLPSEYSYSIAGQLSVGEPYLRGHRRGHNTSFVLLHRQSG